MYFIIYIHSITSLWPHYNTYWMTMKKSDLLMCLTVTLISNQINIDIYNVFLISYSAENVVIYYFFTIHLPLLLDPSLSTIPFWRKYCMIFWICFLDRLNSSINLTCVTKGFSLILLSISRLLSVPFLAPFDSASAPS